MDAEKTSEITDESPLRMGQIAQVLPCSRFTVRRWVKLGYEFQYGTTTTLKHLRAWLEANRDRLKRRPLSPEKYERMVGVAASARELKRLKKERENE